MNSEESSEETQKTALLNSQFIHNHLYEFFFERGGDLTIVNK